MGSLAAFAAILGAQASEGTGTGVSDCVLGSTARDISGSNPSRSTEVHANRQDRALALLTARGNLGDEGFGGVG